MNTVHLWVSRKETDAGDYRLDDHDNGTTPITLTTEEWASYRSTMRDYSDWQDFIVVAFAGRHIVDAEDIG